MQRIKITVLTIALAWTCGTCWAQVGAINPYADEFHNPLNPNDVDANGLIQNKDALLVINRLKVQEQELLQSVATPAAASLQSLLALATTSDGLLPKAYFWDTTGDGLVSPKDAVRVINALHAGSTVPEPNSLILAALALAAVAGYVWRRKRAIA